MAKYEPRINTYAYKQDKNSRFEYKYENRKWDFIHDIAYWLYYDQWFRTYANERGLGLETEDESDQPIEVEFQDALYYEIDKIGDRENASDDLYDASTINDMGWHWLEINRIAADAGYRGVDSSPERRADLRLHRQWVKFAKSPQGLFLKIIMKFQTLELEGFLYNRGKSMEETQRLAYLLQHTLQSNTWKPLQTLYEAVNPQIGAGTLQMPINDDRDNFLPTHDIMMPTEFQVYVDSETHNFGVMYHQTPVNNIIMLYQNLNTPDNLLSLLQSPIETTNINRMWLIRKYIDEDHNNRFPMLLRNSETKIELLGDLAKEYTDKRIIPTFTACIDAYNARNKLDEDKATLEALGTVVSAAKAATLDEEIGRMGDPAAYRDRNKELWKTPVNWWDMTDQKFSNAGNIFLRNTHNYIRPVLQNAIPGRKLGTMKHEIEHDLQQKHIKSQFGNSILSLTMQWFIVCTKTSAVTNSMENNLSPARYRMSIQDKSVQHNKMWELIKDLAPNSTAIINPSALNMPRNTKMTLPTWINVSRSCGYNLRI